MFGFVCLFQVSVRFVYFAEDINSPVVRNFGCQVKIFKSVFRKLMKFWKIFKDSKAIKKNQSHFLEKRVNWFVVIYIVLKWRCR